TLPGRRRREGRKAPTARGARFRACTERFGDGAGPGRRGHFPCRRQPGAARPQTQGTAMNKSVSLLSSLLLCAFLSGGALAAEKVDINNADAQTLGRVLDGVGPAKAEAIVRHRAKHGGFRTAAELAGA